ncbi:MAG TPA: phosphoglycolate phosphatase [Azospirillum sp.]|nr:phosphoglycolate phosphatase [Azospirillum sp.]
MTTRPPLATPFAALVFDFDGTLIDSVPDITRVLNRTLAAFGRPPLAVDQVRTMVGDGSATLVRSAFAATGGAPEGDEAQTVLKTYLDNYYEDTAEPSCFYPGVPETLRAFAAQGIKLGLCTNKPERIARKLLGLLGVADLFGAVAGGDTLPTRKPDPGTLAWVLEQLGERNAAMVGDNGHDVKVARAVGIPVVAVSYGYPRMPISELGADAVIDHFADLPAALAALPTEKLAG